MTSITPSVVHPRQLTPNTGRRLGRPTRRLTATRISLNTSLAHKSAHQLGWVNHAAVSLFVSDTRRLCALSLTALAVAAGAKATEQQQQRHEHATQQDAAASSGLARHFPYARITLIGVRTIESETLGVLPGRIVSWVELAPTKRATHPATPILALSPSCRPKASTSLVATDTSMPRGNAHVIPPRGCIRPAHSLARWWPTIHSPVAPAVPPRPKEPCVCRKIRPRRSTGIRAVSSLSGVIAGCAAPHGAADLTAVLIVFTTRAP
jgi:hypothetical protein